MLHLGVRGATKGSTILFADAKPEKEIVAHELAHIAQQYLSSNQGSSDCEEDAHQAAKSVIAGKPVQLTAKASSNQIYFWDSHEHKAFGNLAAIRATGGEARVDTSRETDETQADDDNMLRDINRQGSQALRLDTTTTYAPRVPFPIEHSISFGDASELSGDYESTPEGLGTRQTGDTGNGPADYIRMVSIAQTNVNHFYPLNHNEYRNHHARAVQAAQNGDQRTAMLEEGFASHFLQDCFAAGHMAPRALDRVSVTPETESELGLNRSKKWHDELNKFTSGLPTSRGNFRGDDTMNGSDLNLIADETTRSLEEIMGILRGENPAPANIDLPVPDYNKIMDSEYATVWRLMTEDYEEDLRNAERQPSGQDEMTDGNTPYSTQETAQLIRENTYGGNQNAIPKITNTNWNGSTLVFNLTIDNQIAPAGSEIWYSWYDQDGAFDRTQEGHTAGEFTSTQATVFQDRDELIQGPLRYVLSERGVGSILSPADRTNNSYVVFFSDSSMLNPIARSNAQGDNQGSVETPITISSIQWSGNSLSFYAQQNGQPVSNRQLYLRWYNRDAQFDRNDQGYMGQTTIDGDSQVGRIEVVNIDNGRTSIEATGDANNSNDTYAVIYLDENCTIPLGRSAIQP